MRQLSKCYKILFKSRVDIPGHNFKSLKKNAYCIFTLLFSSFNTLSICSHWRRRMLKPKASRFSNGHSKESLFALREIALRFQKLSASDSIRDQSFGMQQNVSLQLTERRFERVLECKVRAKIRALLGIIVADAAEKRNVSETAPVLHRRPHFAVEGFGLEKADATRQNCCSSKPCAKCRE